MKILKSTSTHPRRCKYGNFELKPDEGWELSKTFIDFESKLLIVSVSIIDESKWADLGYDGKTIPRKEYKIDLQSLQILDTEEWIKYFNYDKVETISDDGKYRLVSQRHHRTESEVDILAEELYELPANDMISTSTSAAFGESESENLLEQLYSSRRKREAHQKALDAKPTLGEYYLKKLEELEDEDKILYYHNKHKAYRLIFSNGKFELSESKQSHSESQDLESMRFAIKESYNTIDKFWQDFSADEKWFVNYKAEQAASKKILLLAKHINLYFNELRKEHKFTYGEYEKINDWSNIVWSDDYKKSEIKQWCSNCYKEVDYQSRYPKYICGECASKEKLDKEGNILDFSNEGFSGGFVIVRRDRNGKLLSEDSGKIYCDCIIDNKLFFAQEGRFGGVVIQLKE